MISTCSRKKFLRVDGRANVAKLCRPPGNDGRPHHAGYFTHGFSNVVVFDKMKLLEEAKYMSELDKSLWASVGAHALR